MTYIPTGCKTLKESIEPQIRLLIQGFPGVGKTWGGLTFPNPVVLNLDRGLGAHFGREDVVEVPLYDAKFVRDTMKKPSYQPSDLKDTILRWLETEGTKLSAEQTLVFDGNTGLQNAYHKWYDTNKALFFTQSGQENSFKEWTVKKTYYGEVMEVFKTLRCHVVFLCHEVDLKDKNGPQGPSYSGKIRPLLTGAFGDELGSHFTDVFRAHAVDRPTDFSSLKSDDIKKNWGMTIADYQKWCMSFPRNTIYYWQTESDNIFDAKASSLVGFPKFIPANYESFIKYRRSK